MAAAATSMEKTGKERGFKRELTLKRKKGSSGFGNSSDGRDQ